MMMTISNVRCKALLLACLVPASCTTAPPPSTPAQSITGDQTVHCLLPPKVQKLGNLTYPSRRVLTFETATRCTLRGGEYTLYDRSSAQSSADFYSQLAANGDMEAQYSLALVYESLFDPPRYDLAAKWYRQAADQGHPNALKNLSYLHEQGLGVPQDSLLAVNLLRQAGGITDDLVLTSVLDAARSEADQEIRRLSAALEQQNAETTQLNASLSELQVKLDASKNELDNTRGQLGVLVTKLETMEPQAQQAANPALLAEINELKQQVRSRTKLVQDRELQIASLEADLSAQQAQLAASEQKAKLQADRLSAELADARSEAEAASQSLNAQSSGRDAEIIALRNELQLVRNSLSDQRKQYQQTLAALDASQQQVKFGEEAAKDAARLSKELALRETQIAQQSGQIAALESRLANSTAGKSQEIQSLQVELASLQSELGENQSAYAELQQELEQSRKQVEVGQVASTDLSKLRTELDSRSTLITQQSQRIEELEQQAARAGLAIDALQSEQERQVSEIDYLHAQLVTKETELVATRARLTELNGQLSSAATEKQRLVAQKESLESALQQSSARTGGQIEAMQSQLSQRTQEILNKEQQILALNRELATVEAKLASVQSDRDRTLALRSPRPVFPKTPNIDLPAGSKYALIIGNDKYENYQDLTTAQAGALAVNKMLQDRYGFETDLLVNASRRDVYRAFNALTSKATDDDYVLIYYAGHGAQGKEGEQETYWLPTDTGPEQAQIEADGIKSTWITSQLRSMKARHVMIIADSCYAGAMVRRPQISVVRRELDRRRLEYLVNGRSRTVLTSGGDRPVLDESHDGGKHSVFTQALLEVLEQNPDIIYGEALHAALVHMVRFNAEQLDFSQIPRFSEIADAGHLNGQFVLKVSG